MKTKRTYMTAAVALVAMVLSLAVMRTAAAAAPDPTPTDLGLPTGYVSAEPWAINAVGEVVGNCYDSDYHAYPCIWQPTADGWAATVLPTGDFDGGEARAINDSGEVVGFCYTIENQGGYNVEVNEACVWEFDGSEWTLTPLGIPTDCDESVADAINNAGQILWHAFSDDSSVNRTFIGTTELKINDVTPIFARADSFNEYGQVLGFGPYGNPSLVLWDNTTEEATTILGDADVHRACLNNLGQVVGWFRTYGEEGPTDTDFIYDPDNGLVTNPVSDSGYYYDAVNDSGQVLASSEPYFDEASGFQSDLVLVPMADADDPGTYGSYLGAVPDGVGDFVALNANGEVGGEDNQAHPFYASAPDGIVWLDGLAESIDWQAFAMNDGGMIAGGSLDAEYVSHPVVWGTPTAPSSALDISDVTATSPSPHSPNITVTVTITNPSTTDTDYDVTVISAKLGAVESNSALPLLYGAIKPGASKKCTLHFKYVDSGNQTLTIQGNSSLGAFSTTQTVNVP